MATVTAQPPVNVDELQQQFTAHAENVLTYSQLSLAADGRAALADVFTTGATVMVNSRRTSAADVGKAQHGVGLLAQGIVLQAQAAQTQLVQANVIQKVKEFFCPGLWPFC